MTPAEHMPGDVHNVWRCPHADCRAVQQRERTPTALANRRQRTREAYWDAEDTDCLETAIETATRVRVDDEIISAALKAVSAGPGARPRYVNAIKAAFRAAGFEVEQ